MLDFETFQASVSEDQPPQGCSPLLEALWWDAKDDWDQAHRIAQDIGTADAARVHAYLHRKEGDEFNAGYWYSRAGADTFRGSLEDEWQELVHCLLAASH